MKNIFKKKQVEKVRDRMVSEKEFFYQDYRIIKVEDGEEGYKRVQLQVAPNVIEVWDIPSWELDVCISPIKSDATTGRNERAIYVVDKLHNLLSEMNIRIEEVPFIVTKLIDKFKGMEDQVFLNLIGKKSDFDIRLNDWEKNLTKDQK